MKKFQLWLLAAILFLCGNVLTSCSSDAPIDDPILSEIIGTWYAEYDKTGTVPNFELDGTETYTRAIQYYEFEADGTGYWIQFMLNDLQTNPINQYGSRIGGEAADGAFTYTANPDGTVNIQLKNVHAEDIYPSEWTLKPSGSQIIGFDENVRYQLSPATDFQKTLACSWDDTWHGGSGVESDTDPTIGTPQRKYALDWEIINHDRQMVCLEDVTNGMLRGDFDQIIFEYTSVGPDLKTPVRLTGSINMPRNVFNKTITPRHLMMLTQWTHASRNERLTVGTQYELEVYMNPSSRIIAVSSDLYGWTLTADQPQAYCCPEITAVESLDCWDAAMEILREKGYDVSDLPITNIGYSSAGMQAIGIQRFIDEHRPDIKIALTAAGASPFDISTVWLNYIKSNYTSYVCALPLIMVAYNETYHLGLDYKDIFLPPLCDHIQDWILSKDYNTDAINEFIGDKTVDQILTPAARDWSQGIGRLMYDKFVENSLCAASTKWQPNRDTQFFIMHSEGDTYMDWHVSQQMALFLVQHGCKVVTDFSNSGDHVFNGSLNFLFTSCLMMEFSDSQEESQSVIDTVQEIIQAIMNNPDALAGFL